MAEEVKIKKSTVITVLVVLVIGVFLVVAVAKMFNNNDELVQGGSLGTNKVVIENGVQVVNLGVANYNYDPYEIRLKEGQPVKIIGNMNQLQGCLKAFTIPQLGISKLFKNNDNVLEFTPKQKGVFGFSCSMGMGSGNIIIE